MKKLNNRVPLWVTMAFCAIWTVVIGLDYVNKHPYHYDGFQHFKYVGLFAFFLGFLLISWLLKVKGVFNSGIFKFKGYHILLAILMFFIVLIFENRNYGETPSSFSHLARFTGLAIANFAFLVVFYQVCRSFGDLIYEKFLKNYMASFVTVSIAIGVLVFTSFMYVLGALGFINSISIIVLIVLMGISNIPKLIENFKNLLFKDIELNDVKFIGWSSLCVILFFLSLNFLSVHMPFPSGFDARNVYLNISKIVAQNGSLVEGFQPYNWSLLMSMGFLLINKAELVFGISVSAFVLALLGGYEFATRILKINKNYVLFSLALIAVTPAFVNQLFIETKGDFGMLFYQMACLIVFFSWLDHSKGQTNKNASVLLVLLGLFSGFALGIKLINLFLVFVLIGLIWWDQKNKYGLLGILLISASLLIFAGIDELSGLQKYHLSINQTALVSAVIGLLFIVYAFVKNRDFTMLNIVYTIIFGVSTLFMFSPWMVKNYIETKSLSPKKLLMGKTTGPQDIAYYKMMIKYNNHLKEQQKLNQ